MGKLPLEWTMFECCSVRFDDYSPIMTRPLGPHPWETAMEKIKFLGTTSTGGSCPTAFETETEYLIQGSVVTDPEVLALIAERGNGIPDYETVVAIPKALAKFLPQDGA